MLKLDDMQKTTNESVDATTRSFEGTTKVTQAIAAEIADYTRRSFEHGAKTMEKVLGAKSPTKHSRCRPNTPEPLTKIM